MVIGVYICIHKLGYACKHMGCQAFFHCIGSGYVHSAMYVGGSCSNYVVIYMHAFEAAVGSANGFNAMGQLLYNNTFYHFNPLFNKTTNIFMNQIIV